MKQLLITIAAVVLVGCGPSVPDISIHDAALDGNIEAVKQHLDAGADVNAADKVGETPLHCATTGGRKEIAELLIVKGADVNKKTPISNETPLHYAPFSANRQITKLLISKGAIVNAISDSNHTPLDIAEFTYGREKTKQRRSNLKQIADLLRKHGGKRGKELKAEGK